MTETPFTVIDLGTMAYASALEVQRSHVDEVLRSREGGVPEVGRLLLVEHAPVVTVSNRPTSAANLIATPEMLERAGVEVCATDRGGDITYHGPGQLVAYGIIDLRVWGIAVLDYLAGLERTVLGVLADWGLRGERSAMGRGVWVGESKIASAGLNVRRGVTMHGIALNIDPDMSHFALINPCGMENVEMTSMVAELGKQVGFEEVSEAFVFHFGRVFECDVRPVPVPGAAGMSPHPS